MEPTVLGKMLRYHWIWIVVFALVGLGAGAYVGQQIEPEYTATSSVATSVDVTGGIRPNELNAANIVAISRAQTYAELVDSVQVMTPVIAQLGSTESVSELASRVSAATVITSPVITITATASTATGASDLANAVASSLINTVNADAQAPASATVTVIRLDPLATASAPSAPSSAPGSLFLLLGLLVGALVGVLVSYAAASGDRRLRNKGSVEQAMGRPVLGPIAAAGGSVLGRQQALASVEVTEGHRAVGTSLMYMARESGQRVWVVAGAAHRDGGVGALLGIGKALAETGSRVLLVDVDLRRSPLAGPAHAAGAPGLSEIFAGDSDASVIQPSTVQGLDVLPAGSSSAESAGLLGGTELVALVQELKRVYDFILISAPPVQSSALAGMATQAADGVLLTAGLGRSAAETLGDSTRALEAVGATVVGLATTRKS